MRDDSANTVSPYPCRGPDVKLLRFRSSDVFLPRVHKCQWYVCIMQLDALPHEGHRPPRVVKSSLKGSRSQLSLEEVALAARRNAARKHTRNKADGILRSLLHCAEKARKVSTACQVDLRQASWTQAGRAESPCSRNRCMCPCCRDEVGEAA